ncbi:unnamed protein product [Phytophthora fragariaefolia]|uniref:Unnamed protein product n=1 Tax=Phytophthora fragariaefolia TaxID=1490495 RepID=A0A9W6U8B9_9STRA|nr:unnamed protein product [Phytophthora fragariaefolia]
MFGYLGLDSSLDDVLTNPVLNVWSRYLDEFNTKFPRDKVLMIDTFRVSFGDEALLHFLIKAKETPSTQKIASNMETSLLNKWILERINPDDVSQMIKAGTATNKVKVKLLETYSRKFKETYG